jgi:hypothetical protein
LKANHKNQASQVTEPRIAAAPFYGQTSGEADTTPSQLAASACVATFFPDSCVLRLEAARERAVRPDSGRLVNPIVATGSSQPVFERLFFRIDDESSFARRLVSSQA